MYRQFLKAGQAATEGHNKKHIRSLIREGFENPTFARDPEIEIKGKVTKQTSPNSSLCYSQKHTSITPIGWCARRLHSSKGIYRNNG